MPWANAAWETLLPVLDEQGYLIPAFNTDAVDYIRCAEQLAVSIRVWHPDAKICLLTDQPYESRVFDYVQQLPYPAQTVNPDWKLANDWQAGYASPFRETIKLEADMLITSAVDHWWLMLRHRDVAISVGARDWKNMPATSRFYRKTFDQNLLPDVYNAVTYWRVSSTAVEFWRWVRLLFENWDQYKTLLKFPDSEPTTDLVYAMVAVIMGPDRVTLPATTYPRIVHMKKHIAGTVTEDWTRELVWEHDGQTLKVNTVAQSGAFHYNIKTWQP